MLLLARTLINTYHDASSEDLPHYHLPCFYGLLRILLTLLSAKIEMLKNPNRKYLSLSTHLTFRFRRPPAQ